jgi:acyl carrier protein
VHENHGEIGGRIRALLAERLRVSADEAAIADDASLLDLGLDSTAILTLVVGLEETFDIEIADQDINPHNFGSLRSIGDYVARRMADPVP